MLSPLSMASDNRFKTTTPQPSPRTYPFAEASKVLPRPAGDNIFAFEKLMYSSGARINPTPPARARLHSRLRRLCDARCMETSEEEHAVSTDMLGPINPKTYDRRPAAMHKVFPVAK